MPISHTTHTMGPFVSLCCVLVIRSDNDNKINEDCLWKGRKFRLLLSEDSPTCKLQPYN
jgi:hypothetical protein